MRLELAAIFVWPVVVAAADCAVRGRVSDEAGRPVEYAAVTLWREFGAAPVNGATADAEGNFCIGEVADGVYQVRAFPRSQPGSASPSCRESCGPSREFATAAAPGVRVSKHAAAVLAITMRRVPAFS